MKNRLSWKCLVAAVGMLCAADRVGAQTSLCLSFDEAVRQLHSGNRSLQMADKEIENAREERGRLNAHWLPSLQGAGAYVHLSEKIEVRQPLSQFTEPIKGVVEELLPDNQFAVDILDGIGAQSLVLPLAPRNLTSVGLAAEWVIFSGGKRLHASKIGNTMVDMARENRLQVEADLRTLLAESYFGLRLAQEAVQVRSETLQALQRHYDNALKMESAGIIDKAALLVAEVNRDEARRMLEASQKEVSVVQSALCMLLNLSDTCSIHPTTPLFINPRLPAKEEFRKAMTVESPTLNQLRMQQQIAHQQLRIEQGSYLPEIALFGKQTLYAHGIASNLLPRSAVGVCFTWNLFDGLSRERRIRQARIAQQTLSIGEAQAAEELDVGIDKLYTALQKAQDNVAALQSSIDLGEELVRIRRKSFTEGMATSSEVVDAETLLANVRLARLSACYDYDVALMRLLALCGTPEEFKNYICASP